MIASAEDLIKEDEGFRSEPYRDSVGNWTVGYGHRLYFPMVVVDAYFRSDYDNAVYLSRKFCSVFDELDPVRQAVLINMSYNLGKGILEFVRLQESLRKHDYQSAAGEILSSRAARQLAQRYRRLSEMMSSGRWPE